MSEFAARKINFTFSCLFVVVFSFASFYFVPIMKMYVLAPVGHHFRESKQCVAQDEERREKKTVEMCTLSVCTRINWR